MNVPQTFSVAVQYTITRFEADGLGHTWVEGECAGSPFKPFRLSAVGGFDSLRGQVESAILGQVGDCLKFVDE